MNKKFFIVGTDTNIGKTTATIALMQYLKKTNATILGLKPLATGCFLENNKLYNQDALLLQRASNLSPSYEDVNPFKFEPPASPHIVNNNITASTIANFCNQSIQKYAPDYCLIEGAGGWFCPLNNQETFADLAVNLNAPIILVVGIKLGCLNHAILTYQAIINSKLKIHGWIANYLDEQALYRKENLAYLKNNIAAPLLGSIDYISSYPESINLSVINNI